MLSIMGEAMHVIGVYEKSLHLPFNFVINEILQKKYDLNFKKLKWINAHAQSKESRHL